MVRTYDLRPTNGQKSFYGKAYVLVHADGSETLYSYETPIITRTAGGEYVRLWNGWTATTGKHIKSFCGMNKAQFTALQVDESNTSGTGSRTLTNAESYTAMMARRFAG